MREVLERPITYWGSFTGSRGTLYTCPANCRATVRAWSVEVSSGTGVTATMEVYDSSASTYYVMLNGASLPAIWTEHDIVLEAGDSLHITGAGTSPVVHSMATVLEEFIQVT